MIIIGRAGERDEATGDRLPFSVATLDHVQEAGDGGPDSWANCWAASIDSQRWKAEPYSGKRGRLHVVAHGDGTFTFRVLRGTKHEPITVAEWTGGRQATEVELAKLAALR